MDISNIKKDRALAAIRAAGGLGSVTSLARVAQVVGSLSSSEVGDGMLSELVNASSTLSERLEACECLMVRDDDLGLVWEALAEAVRTALMAQATPVASELLEILEHEVMKEIFHDYLKGEYREEIERRIKVFHLSREH